MTHTHALITNKILRSAYARELWDARAYKNFFETLEYKAMLLGLESGVWAVQKSIFMDVLK